MRTRVIVLIYLALFAGDLSWTGVTPLIPTYVSTFGLTDAEGGLVLSVASLGILVVSLPAGAITRRISPRALTLTAMAVITAAGIGMLVAHSYWGIVAARLVFGLGFGTLWVSMAAWLDDAAGPHSPRVLALTTAVVGVSSMLGPGYAGWVADHYGTQAPFAGLTVVTAVLFVLLLVDRSGTGHRRDAAPPTRELISASRTDPDLRAMLLLTTAAAVVWMTSDLLIPLRLADGGFNVARIGITFSVASVLFISASALTARGADRWARPRIAATATALLAVCTAVPALLTGVPASLVFLGGASVTTGVGVALTYPFGLYAVRRGFVTVAVMSALANIIWALAGLVGPSVGGAFAEWAGDRVAFALLTVVCVAVAASVARPAGSHATQ